jgi:CelD/BcsL family acetyltransferase involved in cellulose biosynthesis
MVLERIPYDASAWGQIVAGYPDAEVYHSPEWLAYLAASQSAEPVVAMVREGDRQVGYFVGAIARRYGFRVLGSPLSGWGTQVMGFLLEDGASHRRAAEALVPFAFGDLGCVHVELGDRGIGRDWNDTYVVEGGHTYAVQLQDTDAAILSRMHGRARTYVRRAARRGLYYEIASSVDFADEFHEQLQDVFGSKQLIPTYSVERVRMLIEHVWPSGQVLLLRICDPDGTSLATAIVVGRNKRASLWGAASFRRYSQLHPNELLHWEIIRYWRDKGAEIYDMGGEGEYKAKYGGVVQHGTRLHRSRYLLLEYGRNAVRSLFYARQRIVGRHLARAGTRASDE